MPSCVYLNGTPTALAGFRPFDCREAVKLPTVPNPLRFASDRRSNRSFTRSG
jgi:hypothetical protein